MNEKTLSGRIFEISNDRKIVGRKKIKVILHEIYPSADQWQTNGISWNESYTMQNIESVTNMSLCVEFLSEERRLPYGHGLTGVEDNVPYMEDATVIGHCERGYIDDVEIDGSMHRVLIADGYIDEIRYPKFVNWLKDKLENGSVKGSVEIVGRPENENHIIYDGGWKAQGRVPQIYDYVGYALLGIMPADDAAIVMELNNKYGNNKEEVPMDEKQLNKFVDDVKSSVAQVVTELNQKDEAHEAQIAELNNKLAEKDGEISELNSKLTTANEDIAAKEQTITEQTTELNSLKDANATLEKEKKVAELNSALTKFSDEEKEFAKAEIEAFNSDPTSVEINSITSKICVEMVRKSKEAQILEQNNASPDIFGSVYTPEEKGEVDIF